VFAVLATLAVHPELGLLLVKGERDGDELVLVVAVAVVALRKKIWRTIKPEYSGFR
jgi:hypothetical protein